jgi:hypothetical protein
MTENELKLEQAQEASMMADLRVRELKDAIKRYGPDDRLEAAPKEALVKAEQAAKAGDTSRVPRRCEAGVLSRVCSSPAAQRRLLQRRVPKIPAFGVTFPSALHKVLAQPGVFKPFSLARRSKR